MQAELQAQATTHFERRARSIPVIGYLAGTAPSKSRVSFKAMVQNLPCDQGWPQRQPSPYALIVLFSLFATQQFCVSYL